MCFDTAVGATTSRSGRTKSRLLVEDLVLANDGDPARKRTRAKVESVHRVTLSARPPTGILRECLLTSGIPRPWREPLHISIDARSDDGQIA